MQAQRILATAFSAACLLTACGVEDGGNGETTGGVTEATIARYARFHRDVYLYPAPDEIQTDEETIAYITDILQETLRGR